MCGIAGILRFGDRPGPDDGEVRPALAAMAHRGPDGSGTAQGAGAVLGNVRLAVVDPEGGAQPFVTRRSILTFNGAIHDYPEHRARLEAAGETFRTRSDTEVLTRLLDRDGPAALPSLSGMFAFARHDRTTGETTLARDAFGVKPLLYEVDRAAGELRFASELGGLLALRRGPPRLDHAALAERLSFQVPLGDRTLVAGVRSLPPGGLLVADRDGRVEVRRWHETEFPTDDGPSPAEWEEALRAALDRAGRIALRADVPLGVTLSGGLDSSVTAGLAARHSASPPLAFTGYFDGGPAFDERAHARRAAAELGLDLVEVPIGAADLVGRVRELAVRLEGPIAGPGSLPQLVVAERAARDVTVLVGGQGADELFGGYARHRIAWLAAAGRLDPAALPPDLVPYAPLVARVLAAAPDTLDERFYRTVFRGDGLDAVLGEGARAAVAGYDARAAFAEAFSAPGGDPFHRMIAWERRTLLPALLHVEDRVTMARSVESRVPLLDLRVAELAARIPPRISFGDGEPKRILRRAAAGLAPPSAVARRDKMGFPVPLPALLAGPAGAEVRERLAAGPLVGGGILAPGAPDALLDGAGGHGRHLWFFLLLSEWMEAVGAKP